ncbi:MAG: hypothetical protein WDA22_15485 [Bacteroidota bacterium]
MRCVWIAVFKNRAAMVKYFSDSSIWMRSVMIDLLDDHNISSFEISVTGP